jgi:rubredoxin
MPEMHCPVCGKETLVIKEAVYEGFTRVGERMKCAVCGHAFDAPAEEPTPVRKVPAIFSDDDLPPAVKIFDEGENRTICRYCKNYLVNPFKQWCGRHEKEVEATDTCPDFEPRPEAADTAKE